MSDTTEKKKTELELLKERAAIMDISFHPTIGLKTLRKKVEDALKADTDEAVEVVKVAGPVEETLATRNARLRKEANKLVRINITCMNPNKKNFPGEIISTSNNAIGVIKKFIPFNTEVGYHIPQALLPILQDRKFQTAIDVKENGKKIKKRKLVKEFAIEILPPLTLDELKELAIQQAANNSIGD